MLGITNVPTTGVDSVVVNVTVTAPTSAGYVTVFPGDQPLPNASNLNFVPGQTVPNLAFVKLSTGGPPPTPGWIAVFNLYGNTHVVVDTFGYFTSDSTSPIAAATADQIETTELVAPPAR